MKEQLIEEAKKIQELWVCLRRKGVLEMFTCKNKKAMLMSLKDFLTYFPEYNVEERNCIDYPFQLSAEQDGIVFFTLVTAEELANIKKEPQ